MGAAPTPCGVPYDRSPDGPGPVSPRPGHDGSDTSLTSRFELFRNPMILELGLIGGEPRFLTLIHQGTAHLRLESTTNLMDWSAQAVFQATNGVNRWTNAADLGGSGIFFRLLHLGPDAPGP